MSVRSLADRLTDFDAEWIGIVHELSKLSTQLQEGTISAMKWVNCPRFSGFDVSEWGDVRRASKVSNSNAGIRLKGFIDADGYLRYAIADNEGEKHSIGAHTLVAEAFIGPRPTDRHEVAHNNGSRAGSHYSQLRWATRKENHDDREIHGTSLQSGQDNPRARLTDADVLEMRRRYRLIKNKEVVGKVSDLAKEYGISHAHLCGVATGRFWSHVKEGVSNPHRVEGLE